MYTDAIINAAGTVSAAPKIQHAVTQNYFTEPQDLEDALHDTPSTSSAYRIATEADLVRLLVERENLKGKFLSVYLDLSPIAKKELLALLVSTVGDDGEPLEVMLPLSWAASKDGKWLAERIKLIFTVSGLDPEKVLMMVTDGGGENIGNARVDGQGEKGILMNAFPSSVWLWCNGHMAQLVYKDTFKKVPSGFIAGLKKVAKYCRLGQNWEKLKAHMSRLAKEDGAAFEESLIHAAVADELDFIAEIRTRKGKDGNEYARPEKFDHRILQGMSDIRFASAGP